MPLSKFIIENIKKNRSKLITNTKIGLDYSIERQSTIIFI